MRSTFFGTNLQMGLLKSRERFGCRKSIIEMRLFNASGFASHQAGRMFWLREKRLCGS